MLYPADASAHVKWFCAFDVAGQPEGLRDVLCPDFEYLSLYAILALVAGCLLEASPLGDAITRAFDQATGWIRSDAELVIRATAGFFFVAIWTAGGTILTPELKTSSTFVPWIQLGIAACLVKRRLLPAAALGIATLYAIAVQEYGAFHLMDYPIFLGVASYLALTSFRRDLFGVRPLDVMRWAAGVTLMWASIEKWAYPDWSYPLLITHPAMTLGFDVAYFMRAAGAIEFILAFALLCTPLLRRVSAIVLTGFFIAAIAEFGKLDAIGHSAIIAVLLVIAADDAKDLRAPNWRRSFIAPVSYCASLAGFLILYYMAHSTLFGTAIF